MIEHFNKLSPAEAERLACLVEEAGEVLHAIGKIQRHGWESHNPHSPILSNRQALMHEIADFVEIVDRMCVGGELSDAELDNLVDRRHKVTTRYFHHQENL